MTAILFIILALAILIRVPPRFLDGLQLSFCHAADGKHPHPDHAQRIFAGIDLVFTPGDSFFLLAGNLMTASASPTRASIPPTRSWGDCRRPGHEQHRGQYLFGAYPGRPWPTRGHRQRPHPAMVREGYGKAFTVAVNASASVVAPIIPRASYSSYSGC